MLIQSQREILLQFELLFSQVFCFWFPTFSFDFDHFYVWRDLLDREFLKPLLILDLRCKSFEKLLPGFRKRQGSWLTQCGDTIVLLVCVACNWYLRGMCLHLHYMISILFRNQGLWAKVVLPPRVAYPSQFLFAAIMCFVGHLFPAIVCRVSCSFPARMCCVRHSFPAATTCRSSKLWAYRIKQLL